MRIALLLSGGVDSSVALLRLLEDGARDVTAFYLKVWLEDEFSFLGECPWEEDLRHARAVCDGAGVRLEVVSLQQEYFQRVVRYAVAELEAGRTPSPDIFCNHRIKFGAFLERLGDSFDRVASGHYARIRDLDGHRLLLKGADPVKDQTYFLSHMDQARLARCLFPVGDLPKTEVRRLARAHGLPNRDRQDSQGLCFLGRIRFDDFIRFHLGEKTGDVVELETGRRLGEHRGYWFHTIGQRRGLGLSHGPWYVVRKDVDRNVVFVSHADNLEANARTSFEATDAHWIHRPPQRRDLEVKVRHGERVHRCRVEPRTEGRLSVRLDEPDPGIAPGQFAVFYDGESCLGGARIA